MRTQKPAARRASLRGSGFASRAPLRRAGGASSVEAKRWPERLRAAAPRGDVTNVDPRFAQVFSRNKISGKYLDLNHNLVNDLKNMGIWEKVREKIIAAQGDISSIDEIPQLVNVLRGDMSLVGPRPAIPSEVAQYKLWQRRRLRMRPGLTCLWALRGRDKVDFESWMRLDLQYIDNWSLGLDARIILMTIPQVLSGRAS